MPKLSRIGTSKLVRKSNLRSDDDQGLPLIPRIFLADDNQGDGMLLGLGFADAGRLVKITQAFDGAQAYDLLLSASLEGPFPFDLIVLDLNMPKLDGLELLGRLHRWLGLTGVPIVILTSSSNPMDRQRSLIHNPSAYLTKSEDYKGMAAVIGKLVPYLFFEDALAFPVEPLVLVSECCVIKGRSTRCG